MTVSTPSVAAQDAFLNCQFFSPIFTSTGLVRMLGSFALQAQGAQRRTGPRVPRTKEGRDGLTAHSRRVAELQYTHAFRVIPLRFLPHRIKFKGPQVAKGLRGT